MRSVIITDGTSYTFSATVLIGGGASIFEGFTEMMLFNVISPRRVNLTIDCILSSQRLIGSVVVLYSDVWYQAASGINLGFKILSQYARRR